MEGSRLRLPEASQTPPGAAGSAPPSFLIEPRFFSRIQCYYLPSKKTNSASAVSPMNFAHCQPLEPVLWDPFDAVKAPAS
jgi:hypothetical protein